MSDPFRVLFVCMGNSCRSPIAEAFLRKQLIDHGLNSNVEVLSAGVAAVQGDPPSQGAEYIVDQYQASLDGFKTRPLTRELCEQIHLCVVMERAHQYFIDEAFPELTDKVRVLGQYLLPHGPLDIPDPVGGDMSLFEEIAAMIDQGIKQMVDEWAEIKTRFYDTQKYVVAIGADHRGFRIKEQLKEIWDTELGTLIDCGTASEDSCDHPDFAFMVSDLVAQGKADRGILVCSTGHGMLLSANKVHGIRCVMPCNVEHARMSRTHNNANMLAIGADFMDHTLIDQIVKTWLTSTFLGGKYQRRINKIMARETYESHARMLALPESVRNYAFTQ